MSGATLLMCNLALAVQEFVGPVISSRGAADMNGNCPNCSTSPDPDVGPDCRPSEFLADLNSLSWPAGVTYGAVVSEFALPQWVGGPLHGQCFAGGDTFVRSDGVVPVVSQYLPVSSGIGVDLKESDGFHADLVGPFVFAETEDTNAVLCAIDPDRCPQWVVRSPVELEVASPDGRVIGTSSSSIPGALYSRANDHREGDNIRIPFALEGEYTARVFPKPGAEPTETYTIEYRRGSEVIVLASDVPVSDIPSEGYKTVVDTSGPFLDCVGPDVEWHSSDAVLPCTAVDAVSGLADPTESAYTLVTSIPEGVETISATTSTRIVCDRKGNCAVAGPISGLKIDKKPPSITIAVPAMATYALAQVVATSYACTDGGSGVASCTGPVPNGAAIDTSSLGEKTFTVTAVDNVGNTSTQTVTYTVVGGSPRLATQVSGKGWASAGVLFLDLRVSNTGTGPARNVALKQVQLRTLSGTGAVSFNTFLSGGLPSAVGDLDAGVSTTVRLYVDVPATVTRFSITEAFALEDATGKNLSSSLAQAVIP